jgi:hypothetical protein
MTILPLKATRKAEYGKKQYGLAEWLKWQTTLSSNTSTVKKKK